MWKLHMYWRLNKFYNIAIIITYLFIFSISSASLTSHWAAVGRSLLARFSASASTSSRWLDGLRRKENEDGNFTTWQMKIYGGFGVDWGVPNWPNYLSGIPFLAIFGEPSKIAMYSPNFIPWDDFGHPSVELGLEFLCFIQGSMSYVFYGSLAVLIWKCGFQLLKEAK